MCLGIPALVLEIYEDEGFALVSSQGAKFIISTRILDESVSPGDYVMVHAGYAIGKLKEEDALERLKMFEEILKEYE